MPAALKSFVPEFCLAMANLTAFINGVFELARNCLAAKTLAAGSGVIARISLPMMAAEAPVAIAMAEPVTAAYICQFAALRLNASRRTDGRRVAK
jgi:hypothetical protein